MMNQRVSSPLETLCSSSGGLAKNETVSQRIIAYAVLLKKAQKEMEQLSDDQLAQFTTEHRVDESDDEGDNESDDEPLYMPLYPPQP